MVEWTRNLTSKSYNRTSEIKRVFFFFFEIFDISRKTEEYIEITGIDDGKSNDK